MYLSIIRIYRHLVHITRAIKSLFFLLTVGLSRYEIILCQIVPLYLFIFCQNKEFFYTYLREYGTLANNHRNYKNRRKDMYS